jgi:hypothetical protein
MRAVFCVPVIAAGMIGAALALATNSASAAVECITEPNREPPQGSHWFYRVDRATDRRCWYLRVWTPPSSAAPTAETQRAAPRPPAGEAVQRAKPPLGESAPVMQRTTARSMASQTGQRTRRPLSESDHAALFLEFLRWKEQQRSAQ